MATRGIPENSFACDSFASSQGQDSCAICLGVPENKSYANTCLHEFCFPCLHKWSKVRAECPLCMQPFSSIIHTVKSDHEYYEYEIHKTDQPVPRVPETVFPSQLELQQHQLPIQLIASVGGQAAARNQAFPATAIEQQAIIQHPPAEPGFAGGARSRQTLHTTAVAKPTSNQNQLMALHSMAQHANQNATAAQNHLETQKALLLPKENTVNRFSLRSKNHRGNIKDGACNVNEFCPSSSSTPLRHCKPKLSQVTGQLLPVNTHKVGRDTSTMADSKQRYSSHSELFAVNRPLDLSNPRSNNVGLINRNATSADIQNSIQILAEEEDDESQNFISFSEQGSSGHNESSVIEERDGRASNFQHVRQKSFVGDASEEIVILEIPPKPAPELIILSDSDE